MSEEVSQERINEMILFIRKTIDEEIISKLLPIVHNAVMDAYNTVPALKKMKGLSEHEMDVFRNAQAIESGLMLSQCMAAALGTTRGYAEAVPGLLKMEKPEADAYLNGLRMLCEKALQMGLKTASESVVEELHNIDNLLSQAHKNPA